MLSLERCKELLGPGCSIEEKELECLREHLYWLAEVVLTTLDSGPDPNAVNRPLAKGGPS